MAGLSPAETPGFASPPHDGFAIIESFLVGISFECVLSVCQTLCNDGIDNKNINKKDSFLFFVVKNLGFVGIGAARNLAFGLFFYTC